MAKRKGPQVRVTSYEAAVDLFWSRVDRSGDCWVWQGQLQTKGYGQMWSRFFDQTLAHRIAWSLANGPIPDGMHVLHRCDNPPCCKPAHLFLGTNADNVADMVHKGRHSHGSWHRPFAKLTEEQVTEIRLAYRNGESVASLAQRYGVTQNPIYDILARKTWRHVAARPAP